MSSLPEMPEHATEEELYSLFLKQMTGLLQSRTLPLAKRISVLRIVAQLRNKIQISGEDRESLRALLEEVHGDNVTELAKKQAKKKTG